MPRRMGRRFEALKPLQPDQARAADPVAHASLSASAGTGKTQVLTARVLLLLLRGVAPETILCLTFTKAGAAEMANRIGARLASWVRLKDADLAAELAARDLGHPLDARGLAHSSLQMGVSSSGNGVQKVPGNGAKVTA